MPSMSASAGWGSETGMAGIEPFGSLDDGQLIHRVTIRGGGLSAAILSWGAVLQDLRLDGHDLPLVLGYPRFEHYPAHSSYFGAIAGRYANRIAGARATIDGVEYSFDANFLGRHTLHGGERSFGKRLWQVADHGPDQVTLSLRSEDGDMGFPGNCAVTCTYRLSGEGTLSVALAAETDRPTLVNLANHSYFNLDDGGMADILDHTIQIAAEAYLPVDAEMIPTGAVLPVEGSVFDFRAPRPIRMEPEGEQVAYDHNFCLSAGRVPLRTVAVATGARSGVSMEVRTTEPGVQFYAGHKLKCTAAGLLGAPYEARAGFCLETQVWPDSPSHPHFPQALLMPGDTSLQLTEYAFSRA